MAPSSILTYAWLFLTLSFFSSCNLFSTKVFVATPEHALDIASIPDSGQYWTFSSKMSLRDKEKSQGKDSLLTQDSVVWKSLDRLPQAEKGCIRVARIFSTGRDNPVRDTLCIENAANGWVAKNGRVTEMSQTSSDPSVKSLWLPLWLEPGSVWKVMPEHIDNDLRINRTRRILDKDTVKWGSQLYEAFRVEEQFWLGSQKVSTALLWYTAKGLVKAESEFPSLSVLDASGKGVESNNSLQPWVLVHSMERKQ